MEFIGPLIGFLGLLAGFVYFMANRKPKRLNYYMRPSQAILAHGAQNLPDVDVLVDGRAADNPVATILRIENNGKVASSPDSAKPDERAGS